MSRPNIRRALQIGLLASFVSVVVISSASGQPGPVTARPTSGPVGTGVVLSGEFWAADAQVTAHWESTDCSGTVIGRSTSGSNGRFEISATIPTPSQVSYGLTWPGSYPITVCGDEPITIDRYVVVPIDSVSFELTNSPPIAADDFYSVRLGSDATDMYVTTNDSDPNTEFLLFCAAGYLHTFQLTSDPTLGSVEERNLCEVIDLTYSAGDRPGIDRFTYRICDPEGACDDATIVMEVGCRQTPTTLADDVYSTTKEESVAIDPFRTASHPCGLGAIDRLQPRLVSEPSNGALVDPFTYVPNERFVGTDAIDLQLCHYDEREAEQCSDTARITINVEALPPTANANGPYQGDIGESIRFTSAGSGDPDGSILALLWDFGDGTKSSETDPAHTYGAGGQYTAVLTVSDNDGASSSDEAAVYVHSPPNVVDLDVAVAAGEDISIDLSSAVSDPDNDADLDAFTTFTSGLAGSLQPASDGQFRYRAPNVERSTTTSFGFEIADSRGNVSRRASVRITVRAAVSDPGQPPEAVDDVAESEGLPVVIDVLGNDVLPLDLDGVVLSVLGEGPQNGIAQVEDLTIVYRPAAGFGGTETFEYEVCNESGCSTGTITIEVQLLCDLTDLRVETFEVDPTAVLPGDSISVRIALLVDRLDSTCGDVTLPVTFDDMPLGNITFGLTNADTVAAGAGAASAGERRIIPDAALEGTLEAVVPAQATVGDHLIRLWAGLPLATIGETTLEVVATPTTVDTMPFPEPPPEPGPVPAEPSDRLVPPVAVVAAGGLSVLAAAGAGGLLLAKRRRYAEPCAGPRKTWMNSEQNAEAARNEADAAERRAETAEARASDAEAALAACQEQMRKAGLAPIGISLPGDGADQQVPVSPGFYLEDHPNPYATDREQFPGWFSLQRSAEVRGVVIHSGGIVPPTITTAAEAAQELATTRQPLSLHAIIDHTGVIALLRDERAGRHLATADDNSLGVLWMPGEDEERSLAILGSWCAAKATAHGFTLRKVDFEEWIQGDSGLVAAHDFPEAVGTDHRELRWDELLESARGRGGVALAAPVSVAGGGGDCSVQQQEFTAAQAEANETRAAAAEAEANAEQAEAEARATKERLDECECRHPVIATPVNPATQQQPDESDPSRWFLLAHQNEHGGQRANGRKGWYYASRQQPITGIVVHTAEANSGPGVAMYLSKVRRPASAHVVIDAAGPVDLLPDSVVAFHAKGGNSRGLGLEIAYIASKWGKDLEREALLYRNAAAWCALKALQYGIPVQRVSAQQWHSGASGFISHAELDPSRRTDPGRDFQWDHFFELIRSYMAGGMPGDAGMGELPSDQ